MVFVLIFGGKGLSWIIVGFTKGFPSFSQMIDAFTHPNIVGWGLVFLFASVIYLLYAKITVDQNSSQYSRPMIISLCLLFCALGCMAAAPSNTKAEPTSKANSEEKFSVVYREGSLRVLRDNDTDVLYVSNGRSLCQLTDAEGNPLVDDGSYDEVEEALEREEHDK